MKRAHAMQTRVATETTTPETLQASELEREPVVAEREAPAAKAAAPAQDKLEISTAASKAATTAAGKSAQVSKAQSAGRISSLPPVSGATKPVAPAPAPAARPAVPAAAPKRQVLPETTA